MPTAAWPASRTQRWERRSVPPPAISPGPARRPTWPSVAAVWAGPRSRWPMHWPSTTSTGPGACSRRSSGETRPPSTPRRSPPPGPNRSPRTRATPSSPRPSGRPSPRREPGGRGPDHPGRRPHPVGRTAHMVAVTGPAPGRHGGDGARLALALGLDPGDVLDLSASLNPVAPEVAPVIAAHLDVLGRYPDPSEATAAMAAALGVDDDRLL